MADQPDLTAESLAVLHDSAATRLLQPVRFGGRAVDTREFVSAVADLAATDGSAGWLAAMVNAAAHQVDGLGATAAEQVWGADPAALVTVGVGRGRLTTRRGLLHLTGRWDSVTGAEVADWLLLSAEFDGTARLMLVPRDRVELRRPDLRGLRAAGISDATVSDAIVEPGQVFDENPCRGGTFTAIAGAGAAAAVVGAAHGIWRAHVEQVRNRLATSFGSEDATERTSSAVTVARTASAIDAARLQLDASLHEPHVAAARAQQQAVTRTRTAADRLLSSGNRHALDGADPVSRGWLDVLAGYRLTIRLLQGLGD